MDVRQSNLLEYGVETIRVEVLPCIPSWFWENWKMPNLYSFETGDGNGKR